MRTSAGQLARLQRLVRQPSNPISCKNTLCNCEVRAQEPNRNSLTPLPRKRGWARPFRS